MEQNEKWVAESFSVSQEISRILSKPNYLKFITAFKRPKLLPVLRQMNSVYTLTPDIPKIYFNIIREHLISKSTEQYTDRPRM
jgi:hypothetical protein